MVKVALLMRNQRLVEACCRPDSNGRGKLQKPWFCAYDPYQGEWIELKTMFDKLQAGTFVYPKKPVKSDSKKTVPS